MAPRWYSGLRRSPKARLNSASALMKAARSARCINAIIALAP